MYDPSLPFLSLPYWVLRNMPTAAHFFRSSREARHVLAIRAGDLEEATELKLTRSLPLGHTQPVCFCTLQISSSWVLVL